ncbi:putative tRNA-m1A22 methylase [Anaerovibrio sp. JC8]|uniref:tRNA (adenine(22)-N(1))-methyltransferase n=1 Tax=Anaerovibrio sp. JC8 TaxID=1240085 RepID=UPI000A0A4823|nr:class I SAM-dependent methyltransferase [Anaerovibrio sp. JC8]ORU00425.1 putative tRNA-m1A22 methylase [Anaerovibrio sp. JC8]
MLDDRLQAVADFVPPASSVADIGTDHAYLAIELYKANNDRLVIAADLNEGPCQAARRTIADAGLNGEIEVRQGDGLAALKPGEVETVCIAGMGGKLEADILAAQPQVVEQLKCLVLQPQNGFEYLRQWLYDHKWHIEDETLAKVDGRVYQIIRAVPGETAPLTEPELILGPVLIKKRPLLFKDHVENNLEQLEKIRQGLKKGGEQTRGKLAETEARIKLLEGYLK